MTKNAELGLKMQKSVKLVIDFKKNKLLIKFNPNRLVDNGVTFYYYDYYALDQLDKPIDIIGIIEKVKRLETKEFKIKYNSREYTMQIEKKTNTDYFVGSIIGSVSTSNPVTSYILGGELLKQGVSLIAVTAFLVSWITVGLVQLPAEISFLGKKFALLRNYLSFLFSIIVALITVFLWGIL